MEKIIPAFAESLFEPTMDIAMEIAELGIDSVLDEGIIKSIPIAGLLVGLAKTAQNIYDRNLLRQTLAFIKAFNAKTIDKAKLEKYREKLKKNPGKEEEELGRAIIILNKTTYLNKSKILGLLYRAYVNENISWLTFCELSDITDRLFLNDLGLLKDIYARKIKDTTQCTAYQAERLISIGLVDSATSGIIMRSNGNNRTEKQIQPSTLGNQYCRIIFQ